MAIVHICIVWLVVSGLVYLLVRPSSNNTTTTTLPTDGLALVSNANAYLALRGGSSSTTEFRWESQGASSLTLSRNTQRLLDWTFFDSVRAFAFDQKFTITSSWIQLNATSDVVLGMAPAPNGTLSSALLIKSQDVVAGSGGDLLLSAGNPGGDLILSAGVSSSAISQGRVQTFGHEIEWYTQGSSVLSMSLSSTSLRIRTPVVLEMPLLSSSDLSAQSITAQFLSVASITIEKANITTIASNILSTDNLQLTSHGSCAYPQSLTVIQNDCVTPGNSPVNMIIVYNMDVTSRMFGSTPLKHGTSCLFLFQDSVWYPSCVPSIETKETQIVSRTVLDVQYKGSCANVLPYTEIGADCLLPSATLLSNGSFVLIFNNDTKNGHAFADNIWVKPLQSCMAVFANNQWRSECIKQCSYKEKKIFESDLPIQDFDISDDGSTIYVLNKGGGLFRSTDAGESWTKLRRQNGSPGMAMNCSAISAGGRVQLLGMQGPAPAYLFVSHDYGETFRKILSPVAETWVVASMSLDGNVMLAGQANGLMYISYDSGMSWVPQTQLGAKQWNDGKVVGNGTFMIVCAPNDYLYITRDYGTIWTPLTAFGIQLWTSARLSDSGTIVTIVRTQATVYVSHDFGATFQTPFVAFATNTSGWNNVDMSSNGQVILLSSAVVIGRQGKIVRSLDGGLTWVTLSTTSSNFFTKIVVSPSGQRMMIICLPCQVPLNISTDKGDTWNGFPFVTTSIVSACMMDSGYILLSSSGTIISTFIETIQDDTRKLFASSNNYLEASLSDVNGTLVPSGVWISSAVSRTLAVVVLLSLQSIALSTNYGKQWSIVSVPGSGICENVFVSSDGLVITIRRSDGVLYSTYDNGITWTPIIPSISGSWGVVQSTTTNTTWCSLDGTCFVSSGVSASNLSFNKTLTEIHISPSNLWIAAISGLTPNQILLASTTSFLSRFTFDSGRKVDSFIILDSTIICLKSEQSMYIALNTCSCWTANATSSSNLKSKCSTIAGTGHDSLTG